MQRHKILGGEVQLYRRAGSGKWQCSASIGGKQRRTTTKVDSLAHAKDIAEDWYQRLRGLNSAGLLKEEKTFRQAAEQFTKEYSALTKGKRSKRWAEGHEIRLRVHLLPFFGAKPLSEITQGLLTDYLEHRVEFRGDNPHSRSNRPSVDKEPARNTLHNEIVTLRMVLRTAVHRGWLQFVPSLSFPYGDTVKVSHRPWFSP